MILYTPKNKNFTDFNKKQYTEAEFELLIKNLYQNCLKML